MYIFWFLLSITVNLFFSRPYIMTSVTFAEVKCTLEKWRKGEFAICRNDVKRAITVAGISL
jgi:hypothetical protein